MREAIYWHEIEACGKDASTVTFFADILRPVENDFHLCERIAAVVYVALGNAGEAPAVEVIGRRRPLPDPYAEVKLCDYFE